MKKKLKLTSHLNQTLEDCLIAQVVCYVSSSLYFHSSQDERIIDAPRQRKQTKRYGRGDDVDFELSDLDSDEEVPQAKRRAWTRVECFKVEKNLLVFG